MKVIKKDGKNYLEVKADKNGFIKCPFCLKKHQHGKVNGHRLAHCANSSTTTEFIIEDQHYKKEDGYFISI